jgi:hypothetical protein
VALQEVRRDETGNQPADDYTFLYGFEHVNHRLGTGYLVKQGIIAAAKRVKFINDRISYVIQRGR